MNHYNKIKTEIINNQVYKKVKDYSKSKNNLKTYYNIGKLLSEAGKKYGESPLNKMIKFYKLAEKWRKCRQNYLIVIM